MRAYQNYLADVQALGATFIAVSPQTPDNSRTIAEKNELQFEVLSDAGNTVAEQFGLAFGLVEELSGLFDKMGINLPTYNGDDSWTLPIPGTYVLDRDGTVVLAHVDANYTTRLEPGDILESLRGLN